ncbi:hypothetical protein AAF712_008494 [Marasmius tenuissimus]|uniref:HMG box domain-containing protein n=1 Tax=Marasmius tenuissimus TaxID=585030 RepID=A0ABR2ZTR7_9AGAR
MFASLRLGAVARLARTPVSMSLLGVRPLSTPAIIRRTFLTSSRVNEPTTSKASETKDKATKTTTKKTSAKKTAARKKAAPKKAKKAVATNKPGRPKVKKAEPKLDKALLIPPKRPITPYLAWQVEQNQALGKAKSLAEVHERSRTFSSQWKDVSESDKDKYSQQYTGELREWTQRYAEWYNRLTPEQLKAVRAIYRKKSVRLPKPAGQPTRPPAPFLSFYTEYKKQRPELTVVEASKQSAKAWNELPQATREGYQQRYYAAKEQYVKDLENYKQSFA